MMRPGYEACGSKESDSALGADVLTDLVVK
jgi:hypothetical protein